MNTLQTIIILTVGSGGFLTAIISAIKLKIDRKETLQSLKVSNSELIKKEFELYTEIKNEAHDTQIKHLKSQLDVLNDRTLKLEDMFKLEKEEKEKILTELVKLQKENAKLVIENKELKARIRELEAKLKSMS